MDRERFGRLFRPSLGDFKCFIGVVALAAVLFLWGIWSSPLSDPDAGMYADIARRMVASGDWITPRFNGLRYLEKPPLLHWLTASVYRAFGPSDWGAYFWPALAGVGGVAVTYRIGKEAFGPRVGLLGGFILSTTFGYFLFARIVSTDLLFTLFLSLAFLAFLQVYRHRGKAWSALIYVSLGLAVMTKGFIGVLLAVLVIGAFLALTRDLPCIKRMGLPWGIPLVLIVALPWHLVMAFQHEGFFDFYLVDNQFLRFLGRRAFSEDDVPLSFPAFLLVTFMLVGPWNVFLPAALQQAGRRLSAGAAEGKSLLFILLWAGIIVGFFSLSPLKLEHYGLPAFPPLALLVGRLWRGLIQDRTSPPLSLLIPLVVLSLPFALLGLGSLPLDNLIELSFSTDVYARMLSAQGQASSPPLLDQLIPLFRGSGLTLFVGGMVSLVFFLRRAPWLAFGCFALMALVVLLFVGKTHTLVSEHRSVKPIALHLLQEAGPDDLLIHEGPLENSAGLTFYTGRQVRIVNGRRGDLDFGSRFPEADGLFLEEGELLRHWQGSGRVFFVTALPLDQSILRRVAPQARHLLGHEGRRWLFSNRGE